MNADPTVDAERHMAAQASYTDSFDAALTQAECDIREGFASYFAGNSRSTVPFLTYSSTRGAIVAEMQAEQASRDALDSHEGEAALKALLQGSMSVEQFRAVIVQRHISMWADEIAETRAGADDGWSDDE